VIVISPGHSQQLLSSGSKIYLIISTVTNSNLYSNWVGEGVNHYFSTFSLYLWISHRSLWPWLGGLSPGPPWPAMTLLSVSILKRCIIMPSWSLASVDLCWSLCLCCRYLYVRLDGSMSVKKRSKVVDRFNDPAVSNFLPFSLVYTDFILSLVTCKYGSFQNTRWQLSTWHLGDIV